MGDTNQQVGWGGVRFRLERTEFIQGQALIGFCFPPY